MSWIVACFGPTSTGSPVPAPGDPVVELGATAGSILAGGLPATVHSGTWTTADGDEGGWLVVGLGLLASTPSASICSSADWRARIDRPRVDWNGLDGHYVVLRWAGNLVEGWTDKLGLRSLYAHASGLTLRLSTRLDVLAAWTRCTSLNLDALGAHWLAHNQFSTDSLVEGIHRLGAGGHLKWNGKSLTCTHRPFLPSQKPTDRQDVARQLSFFLTPDGLTTSLGLSGGLDSRLLLSLSPSSQAVHSFGPSNHPDVSTAHRLAITESRSHTVLHAGLPPVEQLAETIQAHAAATHAISPASAALQLRYFPRLHEAGFGVVDGGFGEVARRQFMNRLLRLHQGTLKRGGPPPLDAVRTNRANVFASSVHEQLVQAARRQLHEAWEATPTDWRIEDRLDLLGVRARLPNFFGREQARLDELVVAFMPFAQPSVLQAVFGLPLRERNGGRAFRRLIRERRPELSRLPLVKGGLTYPFQLPPLGAFMWTKFAARLGSSYADSTRTDVLDRLQPLIRAAALRAAADPLYDAELLSSLIDGYYAGDHTKGAALDWWLALEAWRVSLRGQALTT